MLKSRGSLTDRVADILIERILSGHYPVGGKLPAGRMLAQEFDVSAAVIREATERLRTKGLVRTRQGAGCVVLSNTLNDGFLLNLPSDPGHAALLHIYELRLGLEGEAAALAAQRATDADLAQMAEVLAQLKSTLLEPDAATEWDFAFHRCLADATHNPHYPRLLAYLSAQWRHSVDVARRHTLAADASAARQSPDSPRMVARHSESVHREHEAIFAAVSARDPRAARRRAQQHLKKACERLGMEHRI